MSKYKVVFKSLEDIDNFVQITKKYPFEMDLKRGKFVVDAKSILGIVSLGILNQITLDVYAEKCDDFEEDINKFVIA